MSSILGQLGVSAQAAQAAGLSAHVAGKSSAHANTWSGVSGVQVQPAPRVDPFVYASEVAAMQPADQRWRRFQHALFLIDDVIGMHSEGSGSIALQLHHKGCATGFGHVFTLPFDCDDPVQWFAEHVMGMEFPNTKHAT